MPFKLQSYRRPENFSFQTALANWPCNFPHEEQGHGSLGQSFRTLDNEIFGEKRKR